MDWQSWMNDWDVGWSYLKREAESTWTTAVNADPTAYIPQVAFFTKTMDGVKAQLSVMDGKINELPEAEQAQVRVNVSALNSRYADLAAPFYADTKPTTPPAVGFIPLLMVGTLAVGSAGIAWAIAAQDYVEQLGKETALQAKELEARITASKEGRALQTTTLPTPPPEEESKKTWMYALGALAFIGIGYLQWRDPTRFGIGSLPNA